MVLGLAVCLAVAYLLGMAHARWTRSRSAYRDAVAAVPVLRSVKWRHWRTMSGAGIVVAVVAAAVISTHTS
jgi:hypothetical protein